MRSSHSFWPKRLLADGYPYVLEAADVTAVIQQQDRQRFYRLCSRSFCSNKAWT